MRKPALISVLSLVRNSEQPNDSGWSNRFVLLQILCGPKGKLRLPLCGLVLCLLMLALSGEAMAITVFTWAGASPTNKNWSNGANWVGGTAPTPGSNTDLVFPASPSSFTSVDDFTGSNNNFLGIEFQAGGYTISGTGAPNPLAISGIINGNASGTNTIDATLPLNTGSNCSAQTGATFNIQGAVDLKGQDLNLNGARTGFTTSADGGGTINLSGAISDSVGGSMVFVSPGGLVKFTGSTSNTYSGATNVLGGTLQLQKSGGMGALTAVPGPLIIGDGSGGAGADVVRLLAFDEIANTSNVTVSSTGFFYLNKFYEIINSLVLTSGTSSCASVTTRPGKFSLNSDVNLNVNGNGATGATTGAVNPTATCGTIAPGDSPGILNTGSVTMNSATTFTVELNGATVNTGYDQLNVTGTVNLGGATLSTTLGFNSAPGTTFVIINNDGNDPVTGMFNGLAPG